MQSYKQAQLVDNCLCTGPTSGELARLVGDGVSSCCPVKTCDKRILVEEIEWLGLGLRLQVERPSALSSDWQLESSGMLLLQLNHSCPLGCMCPELLLARKLYCRQRVLNTINYWLESLACSSSV